MHTCCRRARSDGSVLCSRAGFRVASHYTKAGKELEEQCCSIELAYESSVHQWQYLNCMASPIRYRRLTSMPCSNVFLTCRRRSPLGRHELDLMQATAKQCQLQRGPHSTPSKWSRQCCNARLVFLGKALELAMAKSTHLSISTSPSRLLLHYSCCLRYLPCPST